MAKTIILRVTLKRADDEYLFTDGLNDWLHADDVYPLIDDADDNGWEYREEVS